MLKLCCPAMHRAKEGRQGGWLVNHCTSVPAGRLPFVACDQVAASGAVR
jgi:hypothetical protein